MEQFAVAWASCIILLHFIDSLALYINKHLAAISFYIHVVYSKYQSVKLSLANLSFAP